jgi:hypothetical protein
VESELQLVVVIYVVFFEEVKAQFFLAAGGRAFALAAVTIEMSFK